MTSTGEYIRRAIARNKQVSSAVRNMPNDQELGEHVRSLYKYDESVHNLNQEQSGQTRLNFEGENETFSTQYKYKYRNWLGR